MRVLGPCAGGPDLAEAPLDPDSCRLPPQPAPQNRGGGGMGEVTDQTSCREGGQEAPGQTPAHLGMEGWRRCGQLPGQCPRGPGSVLLLLLAPAADGRCPGLRVSCASPLTAPEGARPLATLGPRDAGTATPALQGKGETG